MTTYRTVEVDGIEIFYREAGPACAPAILLLHGFPSSSRMWEPLLTRLGDAFHLVAPDYPGFGHSDTPDPGGFAYTFDHLAEVIDGFSGKLGLTRYALFLQDYGGPIGFRLALAHPDRVQALIVQNAVAHEDGLGPLWETRRQFWAHRSEHETTLRENFFSPAATRLRHVGTSPTPENYDPDLWTDELAFLHRPGQADIQADLFFDYQTNVASYPAWQEWLRAHQPPLLVTWGRYDPSFEAAEAAAYKRDVPGAEVHLLDGGHFALDEQADQIADLTRTFLGTKLGLGGTVTASADPAYSHDDDGYVLGHTSGEYQRQRWQARLWEDVTARLLEQVGARAVLRCLDVGCGSGEVMRLMAGLVAATGQVTGIDRDDRLGQEALHVLRDTVPGRFAFVHADAETTDAVPGGPFDLVFARFLLVFARDPAALVRKLYAWTRPGGVLLLQEYDPRTFDIEPQLDTWDEFERVLYGSFRRAGAHPHVGRQLPHLFAAAGLGSPDGTDVAGLLTPLHDILPLYESAYHSLRPAALRSGLTTEAAGEAFLAELAEAADRPDTTAMAPLVISAWKHKPSIPGT